MTLQSHSWSYICRKHGLKGYMHRNVHCSTVYNSQGMKQLKCPLTEEWIKKIRYICTMEFCVCVCVCVCVCLVAQSCPTLCDPMGSLPGSSVHGILQARILEYGLPFPSPGDLPDPGIEPRSPALQVDSYPPKPPGKPKEWNDAICINMDEPRNCHTEWS